MVLTAPNKQFIDLDLLMDLLKKEKPEDFWFYKDCIVNDDGIYARSLDNNVRALLHGEEWHALEEFSKDIKLNLPCTYDKFAVWARRNRFSNILDGQISSETIKIQGMDEFNEKYESIHGCSFWGDNVQSDVDILEIVIDNQTLIDSPIQILIQENNLIKGTEWNYFFVLFSWKGQLEKEKDSIVPSDYINRKDYEDRVTALNKKISEIESCKTNGAFESFVQNGVLSKAELIERQKAVSQIKASRNSSGLSIKKLLDSTVSDLINESKPEDDFSRYFELFVWKEKLEKEARRVTGVDYSDEGRREDRLDLIDEKIKEIDWHLADCPQKAKFDNTVESSIEQTSKPILPSKSAYQVQELTDRWTKYFGEVVSSNDILQWAIDEKIRIYVTNSGLRKVYLGTKPGLGGRRKILAYFDNAFIKLGDSEIQKLLVGSEAEIIMLNLSETNFIQSDEEFDLSFIDIAVIDKNERIIITPPEDIKYLSVMGDDVLAFESLNNCLDKDQENHSNNLKYEQRGQASQSEQVESSFEDGFFDIDDRNKKVLIKACEIALSFYDKNERHISQNLLLKRLTESKKYKKKNGELLSDEGIKSIFLMSEITKHVKQNTKN